MHEKYTHSIQSNIDGWIDQWLETTFNGAVSLGSFEGVRLYSVEQNELKQFSTLPTLQLQSQGLSRPVAPPSAHPVDPLRQIPLLLLARCRSLQPLTALGGGGA